MRNAGYRFFSPLSDEEIRAIRWSGVLSFVLALIVYWLTVAPSASYWDCPEYILSAVRLEPGHPPGNPFWMLSHRVVTAISGAHNAALAINLCSGLFTALAVMLMGRMVTFLVRRTLKVAPAVACVSGVCAALMFAWCDSTWYSAVEAEVYAMSLFFTALTLWLVLKYALLPPGPRASRMLLLTVYLTGLSIGVHQLNLLSIPCLMLIWLWRRNPGKVSAWKVAATLMLSFLIIVLILKGLMPGTVYLAGLFELWAVNSLSLPFYSGVWIFLIVLGILLVISIITTRHRHRLNMCAWSVTLLLIGYSSLMIIPIRAAASPYVNSGNPSDPFSLYSYIEREQYGGAPLLYGRTPYSRPMFIEEWGTDSVARYSRLALKKGHAVWQPVLQGGRTSNRSGFVASSDSLENLHRLESGKDGYILADYKYRQELTPELNMWFPRITSGEKSDIDAYESWIGMDTSNMTRVAVSEALDSLGHGVTRRDDLGRRPAKYSYRPTYLQNFGYFFGYQVGYMYLRYLLWNFSGRQNDITSSGEADHGNFLTGIAPLDELMTGPAELYPSEAGEANPGHNRYFMIPLLLCVLGIVVCTRAGRVGRRVSFANVMLFLLTGVAIVVYINQTVGEPRERDYSFLGSFMAFAVWGAFGAAQLMLWGGRLFKSRRRVGVIAGGVVALAIPVMMLAENYDDHDRSRRDAATDFAINILNSLEPDAILFTDGDNYTFPLWYVQEVLGVRRDVTVVSLSYLSLPSYVTALMQPGEDKRPVAMTAREGDLIYGRHTLNRFPSPGADTAVLSAGRFLELTYNSEAPKAVLPSSKVMMCAGGDSLIVNLREVAAGSSQLPLRSLAILDMVATNETLPSPRPVYWVFHLPDRVYAGLKPLTSPVLFGWRLAGRDSLSDRTAASSVDSIEKGSRAEYIDEMRWGGFSLPKPPYADLTVQNQVSGQRAALIRAGRRALDAGDGRAALRFARAAADSLSSAASPFGYAPVEGKVCMEVPELSVLLIEAGKAEGDTAAIRRGKELRREWNATREAWRRWREGLPPHLRSAVSYRTLRILNQ